MNSLRKLLLPFGWLYGGIVTLRNELYFRGWKKIHRLPVKVISVGNISVGGTGKTPMAEFLLGKLLTMGYRPAYLSRGYGRESKGFLWVDATAPQGKAFGDEAFQVACKFPDLPVAVCENRVHGVEAMLQSRSDIDVVVLDDAFQHLRIHRDLNWVMVDCNRNPWKDLMLPAGNLREPRRGIRRADLFVFTKFKQVEAAKALAEEHAGGTPCAAMHLEQLPPQPFFEGMEMPLSPKRIGVFSGLGNNAFFFDQVEASLDRPLKRFPYRDHYEYKPEDIRKILSEVTGHPKKWTNLDDVLVLTTEKDYFRLRGQPWISEFKDLPLFYVPVHFKPQWGEDIIREQLDQLLSSTQAHER